MSTEDPLGGANCSGCSGELPFDITFAFQPIVNVRDRRIESYEALVRGTNGEGAPAIISRVDAESMFRFDQACRVEAITLAAELGMATNLNLNFMPAAVYRPEVCIQTTLAAARRLNFPVSRLVFEVLEGEIVSDPGHVGRILEEYKRLGFTTAIDDFGSGYCGLEMLADFQPDIIKLDMKLLRNIDSNRPRQAIVRAVVGLCRELNIRIIAEGVESIAEYAWLVTAGIDLFQGYLFARPGFQSLPTVDLTQFPHPSVRTSAPRHDEMKAPESAVASPYA